MVNLRRILQAVLEGRQEVAKAPAKAYRWLCPCGARGQGFRDNQFDVECNADQHYLRQGQPHPLPYVTDQSGNVVSGRLRRARGSVGRHWGWTD